MFCEKIIDKPELFNAEKKKSFKNKGEIKTFSDKWKQTLPPADYIEGNSQSWTSRRNKMIPDERTKM